MLNTPACIKAAVQYAKAYGDSDADAALANLDTVQNAFMAGVEWAVKRCSPFSPPFLPCFLHAVHAFLPICKTHHQMSCNKCSCVGR